MIPADQGAYNKYGVKAFVFISDLHYLCSMNNSSYKIYVW
jgi:hypothetical protein